jgi:hypothetical protein
MDEQSQKVLVIFVFQEKLKTPFITHKQEEKQMKKDEMKI